MRRIARAPRSTPSTARTRYVIDWSRGLPALFQLYLMASYQYYRLNRSVITDSDYDKLCAVLCRGWKRFEHQHKHCVDREQLLAGTGYAINYPKIVENAAEYMLARHLDV